MVGGAFRVGHSFFVRDRVEKAIIAVMIAGLFLCVILVWPLLVGVMFVVWRNRIRWQSQ